MNSSFRRFSKSQLGSAISVLFLVAILASFALADRSSLGFGGGGSDPVLAKVGSRQVTEREMSRILDRQLSQLRQQNPQATLAALAGDFQPILDELISARSVQAYGDAHDFRLSKALIDAEIARLPGTAGLDGKVNQQSYEAFLRTQRLTDAEVRDVLAGTLAERLLVAAAVANPRVGVGVATPYASLMLEARQGEIAAIETDRFAAGLAPTDADLATFYKANGQRYLVPEQRVLRMARITPEAVASVVASEADIAEAYKRNADQYAGKDLRVITQAVVPDQALANRIAAAARGGMTMADAVKPAGLTAADISVGPQTLAQLTGLAGAPIAKQAFAAPAGAIVGPVKSEFGWHVIKIDSIDRDPGTPLAAVRDTLAAQITAEKRKEALSDLVAHIEDQLADGASLTEAAAAAKLTLVNTPLVTAAGTTTDGKTAVDASLAPGIKAGFELHQGDDPVVEALPDNSGYLLVGVDRIVAPAPAPLATIRDRVAADWVRKTANDRASAAARKIAAAVSQRRPMAEAVAAAGAGLPAPQPVGLRRIDLRMLGEQVPPAIATLFKLAPGQSRLVADPQGRGFFVVRLDKVTPGNAAAQPGLIGSTQRDLQQVVAGEYAAQLLKAMSRDVGVKRYDSRIEEARKRLSGTSAAAE